VKEKVERHVLLRLIKALNDDEDLPVIASVIAADPVLTAKVLRFINSAYAGLKRKISSIEDAVAFLGKKRLKELATVLLVSSLLTSRPKEEIKKLLLSAYLAKFAAREKLPLLEEEAFMAAVLSKVYPLEGEELLKTLREANTSEEVVRGITDPDSPVGKLVRIAEKATVPCLKLLEEQSEKLAPEKDRPGALKKACVEAGFEAEKVVQLL